MSYKRSTMNVSEVSDINLNNQNLKQVLKFAENVTFAPRFHHVGFIKPILKVLCSHTILLFAIQRIANKLLFCTREVAFICLSLHLISVWFYRNHYEYRFEMSPSTSYLNADLYHSISLFLIMT